MDMNPGTQKELKNEEVERAEKPKYQEESRKEEIKMPEEEKTPPSKRVE